VLQLIGSTNVYCAFREKDEHCAVGVSAYLTHVITSAAPKIQAEWTTHIFDNSSILNISAYDARLDKRSDEKALDDFPAPPVLIYRTAHRDTTSPGNLAEAKSLRSEMLQQALDIGPSAALREVHRYMRNLEDNWTSSINQQAALEKRVAALVSQLDSVRQGFQSPPHRENKTSTAFIPSLALSSTSLRAVEPPKERRISSSTFDYDEVEQQAVGRIAKSNHGTFLHADGYLSTPEARRAKR
jgi:hypothetical protein